MKLSEWKALKNIIRNGHFENCYGLPCRLGNIDWFISPYTFQDFYRRKTVNMTETLPIYSENIDINSRPDFPLFSGSCNLYHCNPQPIKPVQARQTAMFIRKYGEMAYFIRCKKSNKLQIARWARERAKEKRISRSNSKLQAD